jgi:proteic killer suppression protein
VTKTFRSKPLAELWQTSRSAKIDARMQRRILLRLDRRDVAQTADDMNVQGFDFHMLHSMPTRYSVHVNGPWCVTFEFENAHVYRVDFEQHH